MSQPTPVFRAVVSREIKIVLEDPGAFREHLVRLVDRRVEVVVRRERSKRSLAQNAWVWGCAYPLLAETLGYDRDEHEMLHYALVAKWGGKHFDERLRVDVPNKRSSKLSTTEFSDYMEWLVRFAAKEFGCVIPLPDEAEVPS